MKDLLRKEHYCSKIYTLLIKKSLTPFYRQTPIPENIRKPEVF